jgi:hypothetical protein
VCVALQPDSQLPRQHLHPILRNRSVAISKHSEQKREQSAGGGEVALQKDTGENGAKNRSMIFDEKPYCSKKCRVVVSGLRKRLDGSPFRTRSTQTCDVQLISQCDDWIDRCTQCVSERTTEGVHKAVKAPTMPNHRTVHKGAKPQCLRIQVEMNLGIRRQ